MFRGEIAERLCHNCDEGKTTLYATIVLCLHPPCALVFHVVLQIICQAARPTWRHRIEQWEKSQARLIEDSYKCTEPYAQLYPVYVNALCPKVILQINKHRLKKYTGIQDMENGFVTTDFIESSFGYADCVFSNGGVADCVSQTGAVIGGMNGVFLSRRQQLASHIKARLKRHGGRMTSAEKQKFLEEEPFIAMSVLPRHVQIKAFKATRRMAHPDYLERKAKRQLADDNSLAKREADMKDEERRNSEALCRFKASINHPRYKTMVELHAELQKIHAHPSVTPMYTDTMKCEIVADQLRFREVCLGRVLRRGALHSSHRGGSTSKLNLLLESFMSALKDEEQNPALLSPPEIRKTYQAHPFATTLRLELDQTRNSKTKELTADFLATHADGVFGGHRCTIDYSRGNCKNPEALIGNISDFVFLTKVGDTCPLSFYDKGNELDECLRK